MCAGNGRTYLHGAHGVIITGALMISCAMGRARRIVRVNGVWLGAVLSSRHTSTAIGRSKVNPFIQFVLQLHGDTVWLVLVLGAAMLICGIYLFVRTRAAAGGAEGNVQLVGPMRLFRWLLIATAAIGVLQALFGGILYLGGLRPAEGLHYVYGLIVLGAIPVAYVYSDQKQVRRDIIIMSIAAVAIIGAAVRAFMTGAP